MIGFKKLLDGRKKQENLRIALSDPSLNVQQLLENREKNFRQNEKYYLLNIADSDKYLLTITSAAIGLLLAFIKDQGTSTIFKQIGAVSIVELSLSLIFLVGSSLVAVRATQMRRMQQLLLDLKESIKETSHTERISQSDLKYEIEKYQTQYTKKMNKSESHRLLAISFFLGGIIATITFVSLNLFKAIGVDIPETTILSTISFIIIFVIPFFSMFWFS
ncbi:MAG: hypothetical protein HOO67_06775 [Candidatus Peribacteraceae bacterium]|nr:hypothetical protein [Candidatus Peribacteraceae bacterium]